MEEIQLKDNKNNIEYIFKKIPIKDLSEDIFKNGEAEFNVALVTETLLGEYEKHIIGRVKNLKDLQTKLQKYIDEYHPTHLLVQQGNASPTYISENQLGNFGFTKCFFA